MDALSSIRALLAYSDEMTRRLLTAAEPLSDERLDRAFEMGMSTLRKTLAHILVGEQMWLERQRGNGEAKWPSYESRKRPAEMREEFDSLWPRRDAFLATLDAGKLAAEQPYRDSSGTAYAATLHDMLLESIVHSAHHRAQAVHMLKRVGGDFVELDYMYARRRAT